MFTSPSGISIEYTGYTVFFSSSPSELISVAVTASASLRIWSRSVDVPANTMEANIVKIADAMSAGRPGARRDTLEIYIKRIQKLEEIANSFEGIKRSFAVQSGREVRVIVEPTIVNDDMSIKLARDIANRIESELDYPGQIRVTVVREVRNTEVAK